jgi:rare lipoprotein A (peptidoglycan hydrolase)
MPFCPKVRCVGIGTENSHENVCLFCLEFIFVGIALMLFWSVSTAHAEVASVYGGRDGFCGSRTANGERLNCSGMTAAHRRLPFGTLVRVCHSRCVTVRINDRGPFVRGRDIDLSPAAARAIGLGGRRARHHFATVNQAYCRRLSSII